MHFLALATTVLMVGPCVADALERVHPGCEQAGAQAPVVMEWDERGLARVALPPSPPDGVATGRPFSLWLAHLDFKPFPSAVAAFPAQKVPTQRGLLQYCTLLNAWTTSKFSERAGVTYVSFDPAESGEPSYPYHPAIPAAVAEGLLRPAQLDLIATVTREIERNHQQLLDALEHFVASAQDVATQQRFISSLQRVTRLRSVDEQRLALTSFLDRDQREKVRASGVTVEGSCSLYVTSRQVRVELRACPWQQLAQRWERLSTVRAAAPAKRLSVKDTHVFLEAPDLSLSISLAAGDDGYAMLDGALSGLPGLEASQ